MTEESRNEAIGKDLTVFNKAEETLGLLDTRIEQFIKDFMTLVQVLKERENLKLSLSFDAERILIGENIILIPGQPVSQQQPTVISLTDLRRQWSEYRDTLKTVNTLSGRLKISRKKER